MRNKYRWSLKQKMYAALIAAVLVMAALIWMPAKQTTEAETFEPTPLVIEADEPESVEPQGVYYGTVVITGPGIEGGGYEGLMFVDMDGEYIRITCTDAVRSQFGDVF